MISSSQIKGMLLEEVILNLLQKTGYKTVESSDNDDTLTDVSAGIAVKGRGACHQIDAIADSLIYHPFSNPQRLLLEAKCYSTRRTIGIDILRNAFGVLQDVNEYWVPGQGALAERKRYHYQYAVFATTEFSRPAQEYAFAHDIYIVPLARSAFLSPILKAIQQYPQISRRPRFRMKELRQAIRESLRYSDTDSINELFLKNDRRYKVLQKLMQENNKISGAYIATLGNSFPVFLVPRNFRALDNVLDCRNIRIYWDEKSWYLVSSRGERLFSFDLPDQLFRMYADNGFLPSRAAINLKENYMSSIQAFRVFNGNIKVINMKLDHNWLEQIRERIF